MAKETGIEAPPGAEPGTYRVEDFLLRHAVEMPEEDLRTLLLAWGVSDEDVDEAVVEWREESYVEHEVRKAVAEQWPGEFVEALTRQMAVNIQAADVFMRALPNTLAGARVRTGNPSGRPKKDRPSAEDLWSEMQAEMDLVTRPMSVSEAARTVARRHTLSARHVLRLTKPLRQ